jgi:hypothetical protein
MLENKKKKGILIRSRQEFFEEDVDKEYLTHLDLKKS